jgi:Leucine-rich repeat (LRR) protein
MLILGSECQGGNRLTEIPSSIRECVRLEELDVSHNELKQLPNEVGLLSKLKSITVAYNKLSHLPSSIGQLQLLRSLNVARNRLVELPFELSNTNLRVLDVSHNELTFIPHELTERIGSMNVMLTGNPFEKKLIRLPQFNFHSWSDIPSPPPSPIDKRLYVPSLVELAARVIIEKEIDTAGKLPKRLERYLCLRGGSCGVCETPVVGEFSRLLVNTPCNGQPFLKSQISVCSEMCCKRLGKCFKKKNKSLLDTYLNW